MSTREVLKFGSSVLRSAGDLPFAVDEIYRCWRLGSRVLAIVSAFEGVTDRLIAEADLVLQDDAPAATAAYVASGEDQTAALLFGALDQHGIPARLVNPRDIALLTEGSSLDSVPVRVDTSALERAWWTHPVLVLPGFYGLDFDAHPALFGRGGSDLSALFLAAALGAHCRLLKDVRGVFDTDPAIDSTARRFSALSWQTAQALAGPLIQSKALQHAKDSGLSFEVGRPNEGAGTRIGQLRDERAFEEDLAPPLKVAIVGCGVVGRGVYDQLQHYPKVFTVQRVVVRELNRYRGISRLTTQFARALDEEIDVVVVCAPGTTLARDMIVAALNEGKWVVTSNKAAVALRGAPLDSFLHGTPRRLWYSSAVGGAMPALEALRTLKSPVRELRGILNGTSGVVLDAMSRGLTRQAAVAVAQAGGFAEENPERDLSGRDSADKLTLLIEAAFGLSLNPNEVPTEGIDSVVKDFDLYKLLARANLTNGSITARVAPELCLRGSFLAEARGPENRLEIELENGEIIRLRGQGAGRWPTTVSVMGDLHEIARMRREQPDDTPGEKCITRRHDSISTNRPSDEREHPLHR